METKTDPTTKVILLGILLVLIIGVVYVMLNGMAQDRQDALDRCMETAGTGTFGRIYCEELNK